MLVEDSKIECGHKPGQTGIGDRNFTVRTTEMFGCENIIWAEQNVVIEDNYIHDPIPYDRVRDPHTDSIQMPTPSRNITIRHNTIYGGYINQQDFGNSAITSGQSTNVLVTQQPHGWRRAHLPLSRGARRLHLDEQPLLSDLREHGRRVRPD